MPFGRHRGELLTNLPDEYVEWLRSLDLHDPLRSAIEAEAKRRGLLSDDDHSAPDLALVEATINAGRRTLARRDHPDLGGEHERMVAINNCADWLLAQARGLRV
jgi:hypothetical protein